MRYASLLLLGLAGMGTISSTVFLVLAMLSARRFHGESEEQRRFEETVKDELPAVSLLKPLHGLEPQLAENIESFFRQDYPAFEVLFAVDTADDAALPVAKSVCDRYPQVPSQIIVNGGLPWPNAPAYSFSRMAELAKHQILVTSDSDVIVGPNYLREVVAPLLHPQAGMLTCLYRGLSTGGFWSTMDALGMSVEMTAGVVIANLMEGMNFGLGPTIVVRRDALERIGGYAAIGRYFSNDFIIGSKIAASGYKVILSRHVIAHVVPPMTFSQMWRRQVRWAGGTRRSRPKGHFGTGLVFALPYGLLGFAALLMLRRPWWAMAILGWAAVNRMIESLVIGWGVSRDRTALQSPWLYPVRDLLGFAVWVASYLSREMSWRDGRFELDAEGKIRVRERGQAGGPASSPTFRA